ncbi:MAG TPA: hypothetical protein VJ898_12805 [Natrialbaceae archaeon]|nr:hypothetical protein [Natrialbaceae archaeon]
MADSNREQSAPSGSDDVESMATDAMDSLLSTTDDFETILRVLVLAADAKGIDVRGGWPVLSDDSPGSWDVEIVEIVRDH